MIVFVKLTARRYLALDCAQAPHAWRNTLYRPGEPPATTDPLGFEYADASIIAGPADWTTVEQAAYQHAKRHGTLVTYENSSAAKTAAKAGAFMREHFEEMKGRK